MRKTGENLAQLPVHCVDVVESGREARKDRIRCEIGENLRFDIAGLQAYCFADWDARVFDAFVLAAAVQFCDHTKRRSSVHWGREFKLRVPVHDLALWKSKAVSGALHDALEFLTGDRWHLEFVARKKIESAPPQGHFNLPDSSSVIVPFSDGLDSCAVTGLIEDGHEHKLIRVRLGLRVRDERRAGNQRIPFALVPYRVCYGTLSSVETSARSRGFKFALLSGIAAYLSRASLVVMPESGQGALGPVLVPVGQAYEDYRNHPLFTNRMKTFLSVLLDHEIDYAYPRLWHTKAETLSEFIAKRPDGITWAQVRSCWQGQRQVSVSGQWRQCGICAACMLRRMSVHAINKTEAKEIYVWEDLKVGKFENGAAEGFPKVKPQGALYEYAIAGTLHLDHLAGLLDSLANRIPLDQQIFQLSRAVGLSEQETRQKLERLLAQHKKEWEGFVASLGTQSFVSQWVSGAS